MSLKFNLLLEQAGLSLADVRLLRHADRGAEKGRTAYELWRDDRAAFDLYQSVQDIDRKPDFGDAGHWASFGSTLEGETIFLGLYRVKFMGLGKRNISKPHRDGAIRAGKYHRYKLTELSALQHLAGRLYINWGPGTRSWIQRADRQDKLISELRRQAKDPAFTGYINFIKPLSRIEALPPGWKEVLRASKGIYLLTCPKTKEHYVGMADGGDGFLGRRLDYVVSGHGGNIGLKSRKPSDYQVSILEVAGSTATTPDLLKMETRWKQKLQSREKGLNRN